MNKKQFYEEIDVTRVSEEDKRRADIMLKLVKGLNVRKLLDIGCIPEMTEYFVTNLNCKGIGLNISEKVIKSYKGDNKNLQFVCGDAETMRFKKRFDLIICGELLEHLQNPDKFITKVGSFMENDGYLLLTIPNLASLFNRISLLFNWQPRGINPSRKILLNPFTKYDYNWGHISMFTHYSIKKFLRAYEFKILAIKGTYGGHKGEKGLSSLLRAMMSTKTSFAEQIIILAKKSD